MKYTTRDYEGIRSDMIELLQQKIPEYTDTSQSDAGIVLIELTAHMLDIVNYYNDVVANEVFPSTALDRASVIEHAKNMGYKVKGRTPSQFTQVFEITLQESDVVIPQGYKVTTERRPSEEPIYFETDSALVIPAGMTGLEKDIDNNYIYSVIVTQGTSVDDVLGSSNGTANQEFSLNYIPVIEDSIKVFVNSGSGYVRWNKVEHFIDSTPSSMDYSISVDSNESVKAIFSDGATGKIPPVLDNGILAKYRVGGGVIGNVTVNTINTVPEKLSFIVGTFNPHTALVQGEEPESIERAKIGVQAHSRTLWRAVTEEDFRDLALAHLSVRQVNAFWDSEIQKLNIYLLPKDSDSISTSDLETFTKFFTDRSILGVNFEVHSPVYVPIDFDIRLKHKPEYLAESVESDVRSEIESILAVGSLNFGENFIKSSMIADLMSVEGVKSVNILTPLDDVDIEPNQIAILGSLVIEIVGGV